MTTSIFRAPISFFDTTPSSRILNRKCILEHLSKKTVVYATHQLQFLGAADIILVIEDGQIVQSGTYGDLIANPNGELVRQLAAHSKSIGQVHISPQNPSGSNPINIKTNEIEEKSDQTDQEASRNDAIKPEDKKSEEQEAHSGRVKWSVYWTYITYACGGALVPVILFCQVLFLALEMASSYWMAWAAKTESMVTREAMMLIYALLSGGSSFFVLGRSILMSAITIASSQRLFLRMTSSIFRAPISFFDSTPSSRILNRSSTDQTTVDTDLPFRLAGLVFALMQLIVLMCITAWKLFIIFLVVFALSLWYMVYYITTARELCRMAAAQKAPILHHFSESITGAATIRCFNQEHRFLSKIMTVIDDFSGVAFHNYATMEWLSVRLNFLFNFTFFLVLLVLVTLPTSAINPSLAGLAASYGLNLSVLQSWVIWNLCNVENKMLSVERILQLTRIPSEAPLMIGDSRPIPEWPTDGRIELNNLQVQYHPHLPMVLKGISCTFPGKKKIGVVGRTGSGKSTLIQALFRLVEPAGGQILIDGVDVGKIGLQDLRLSLGIIPQEPTLFQGTMRTNLDPLQQHSDPEIWEVLNKCRMGDIIRRDVRLLDALEDGENWSVGQKQLLCLARVLLKKRRIIMLDEATASMDTSTDSIIQDTIREQMRECTVITVAHRIPTVIYNDMVLVLDQGKIHEYDTPARLTEDKSSAFSRLVTEYLGASSNNSNSLQQERQD